MCLLLTYGAYGIPRGPECVSLVPKKFRVAEGYDWREEVSAAAPHLGWNPKDEDLTTVRGMIEYLMRNHGHYPNCVCRDDVHLPGGAVLIDSFASGNRRPVCVVWEEEVDTKERQPSLKQKYPVRKFSGCCKKVRVKARVSGL